MKASRLVGFLASCFLSPILTWNALPAKAVEGSKKPNILLIYTDDQGFGDAGVLNAECKFSTPNIDRIAKEGLTFVDAHCSDTVCTPSRYGLLTGRYAWRTTLKQGVMGAEGKCLIDERRLTMPQMLRAQGYATAMVGKWHLGMDFPGESYRNRDWSQPIQDMPLDKGFDFFFGVPASLNYGVLAWFEGRFAKVPPELFTQKKPNQRHVDYRIQPPYEQSPEATREKLGRLGMEVAPDFVDNQCLTRFSDRALAWMQSHQTNHPEQPFFLYLPLTSPHYPVCPLPEFHGQGSAGGYGEFMIETDHHVGRLLRFLDDSQLAENTIVIFTSDNGPERSWEQREEQFSHRSNGIFREGKRSIYEGGHRVPFFIRWPAGIRDVGHQVTQSICQTDIFATLAELTDFHLPVDAAEDSHSFLPLFADQASELPQRAIVHHAANGRFAIRQDRWKLIMPHRKLDAELYDLKDDPTESRDISTEHPNVVQNLTQRMSSIVIEGRSSEGPPSSNDTGYWKDLSWMEPSQYPQ